MHIMKEKLYALASTLQKYRELEATVYFDTDQLTPAGAIGRRADLMGFVANQVQSVITGDDMKQTLDFFANHHEDLSEKDKAIVREFSTAFQEVGSLPAKLNREFVSAAAASEAKWKELKYGDDYQSYIPYLQKTIDLTREKIDIWGYQAHPYDALLKFSEPGMTVVRLDGIFERIKTQVVPLLQDIKAHGAPIDGSMFAKPFAISKQREACTHILTRMGFDLTRGMEADTEHPYTNALHKWDVRVTNHFLEDDFLFALFCQLHEGGHGLYEQFVADDLVDLSLGSGLPGGMHEGSSTFWENVIGRSEAFWQAQTPYLQSVFPAQLGGYRADDLWKGANKLNFSPIRIQTDELCYNLHVLLRYELEKEIFEGKLEAKDLKEAWIAKSEAYLGYTPKNLAEGIFQDVHWHGGMFGYFQSYTLGHVYNAQIAATMRAQMPDFDAAIANDEMPKILEWLRVNWYQYGKTYLPNEMMVRMTGEDANADYLCRYLNEKYRKLYQL